MKTPALPTKARLVALYLPQFHAIPENDQWWGTGFTEWTNVKKAQPRFVGHQQPRVPTELGYYDLRDAATRSRQAQLAQAHGIEAFCYYHYWFDGKLLLEQPLERMLEQSEPNFSFCLCWANENWTRRWDGQNKEVLIAQDYDHYDAVLHASYLLKAFADPRYLRVDGKPIFIYYRANIIPDFALKMRALKNALADLGILDLYCCAMARGEPIDSHLLASGVEQLIDFQPAEGIPATGVDAAHVWKITKQLLSGYVKPLIRAVFPKPNFDMVFNYKLLSSQQMQRTLQPKHIPCVFPCWDNSSRRKHEAHIMQNSDASQFQKWLDISIVKVQNKPAQERLVFINAWNEWAEGCYLEPDEQHGDRFLQAVKRAAYGNK